MLGWTKPAWVDGGVCYPECLPPQIWIPSSVPGVAGTCVCEDGAPRNSEGYCCEDG